MFSAPTKSTLDDIKEALTEYDDSKNFISWIFDTEPDFVKSLRECAKMNVRIDDRKDDKDQPDLTYQELDYINNALNRNKDNIAVFKRLHEKLKQKYQYKLEIYARFWTLQDDLRKTSNFDKLVPFPEQRDDLRRIFSLLQFAELLTQERFDIICRYGENASNILAFLNYFADQHVKDHAIIFQIFSEIQGSKSIIKSTLEQIDLEKWCQFKDSIKNFPIGLSQEEVYLLLSHPEMITKAQNACEIYQSKHFSFQTYGIDPRIKTIFFKNPVCAEGLAKAYNILYEIPQNQLQQWIPKYEDMLLQCGQHAEDMATLLLSLYKKSDYVTSYSSLRWSSDQNIILLTKEVVDALVKNFPHIKELNKAINILNHPHMFNELSDAPTRGNLLTPDNILIICKNAKHAPELAKGMAYINDLSLESELIEEICRHAEHAHELCRTIRNMHENMHISLTFKILQTLIQIPEKIYAVSFIIHRLNYHKMLNDDNLNQLAKFKSHQRETINHLSVADILNQSNFDLVCQYPQYSEQISHIIKHFNSVNNLSKNDDHFKILFSYLPCLERVANKMMELSENKKLSKESYQNIFTQIDKDNILLLQDDLNKRNTKSIIYQFFGDDRGKPLKPTGDLNLLGVINGFVCKK